MADVELRHELPTNSGARVPLKRDMECAFAIDEASEVGIQPFLLIVRTDRIVTAHRHIVPEGCAQRGVTVNEYRRILGVSSI